MIAAVIAAVQDLATWRLVLAGCCLGAVLGVISTEAGA